jgi:beta-galactosidase/beta-glucuronidase
MRRFSAQFVALLFVWFSQSVGKAQIIRTTNGKPLITAWATEVSSTNAHPEYPRAGMVRGEWLNLDGLWDCAITFHNNTSAGAFTNEILVPFAAESVLSAMRRAVTEEHRLWCRRKFTVPPAWRDKRILLHFEAVNWETRTWINGLEKETHKGGYDRFTFDITDALKPEGDQELTVSVSNPAETGFEPRGKQMLNPHAPFYSAASGIWQTVWLEPVPASSIESLKLVPDVDAGTLEVTVFGRGEMSGVTAEVVALDNGREVARVAGQTGEKLELIVPNAKLWSPSAPFLYDLKVTLMRSGERIDEVSSYFGMRKISVAKGPGGFPQLMLNNQRLFQLGPLDQGYWPDGIYTAPTDGAMRNDIEVMKRLGFNMCRKHVKIEPERWYYWCDKLGLLVWQDMPNGDRPASLPQKEIQRQPESARQFEVELRRMIDGRGNHPCIVMWIAFNQGWGQYDTARITSMIKKLDPSRLVIGASGWHDMGVGDVRSLHQYPGPSTPVQDGRRACVQGECGGLGLVVRYHLWGNKGFWDTIYFENAVTLTRGYDGLMSQIQTFEEKNGLAGAVITQLTDVETDLNGFMTYDRAVIKMPEDRIREINERVINAKVEPSVK